MVNAGLRTEGRRGGGTVLRAALLLALGFGPWPALAGGDSSGSDEEKIRQVEKEWDDAVVSGNKVEMARLMADDYFNYSDDDQVRGLSKEKFIALLASLREPDVSNKDEIDEVETHIIGETVVVTARVTPVTTIKGKEQEREFRGRFTHIWQKRAGRWQLVGDQYNPTAPIFKTPAPVKVEHSVLETYVGKYGDLAVSMAGDSLKMKVGEELVQLTPASDTNFSFLLQKRNARATFVRNAKGRVTHLFINDAGRAFEVEKGE